MSKFLFAIQLIAFSWLHTILASVNCRMEHNTVLFFLPLGYLFPEVIVLSMFPPVNVCKCMLLKMQFFSLCQVKLFRKVAVLFMCVRVNYSWNQLKNYQDPLFGFSWYETEVLLILLLCENRINCLLKNNCCLGSTLQR